MAVAYSDIARVLDKARRRQGRVILGAAAAFGLAGVLAWVLLGTALLGAGWGSALVLRHVTVSLAAITVISALTWAAVSIMRRASSPISVARSLGARVPELRSDLLSSVELEDEYENAAGAGYSVALIDAHVARTAERAAAIDLTRVVPVTAARRGAGALLAAALISAVAVAAAPRTLALGWRRLTGATGPVPIRRAEPITGDVQLTYVYPAYMKRETKTLSGTGGEITAPKGTEVHLETRADRQVSAAEIVIQIAEAQAQARASTAGPAGPALSTNGEGRSGSVKTVRPDGSVNTVRPDGSVNTVRPERSEAESKGAPAPPGPKVYQLAVKNGRELSGSFVVDEGGSYRFRFTNGKKPIAEGPPLPITVEPDAFPEIRITAPAAEVEVDGRARVHVEWTASDDVGLGDLTLVTKPAEGEERRTPLRSFAGASRHEAGSHDIDLAPMRLAEGERLLYWLEVTDDDAVSGPKRSASATQTIKIYSEAEHHQAALAKAQRLWEEMVGLLGDRLAFFDEMTPARGTPEWNPPRAAQATALDGRARALHDGLRTVARELRRDRAAPKQLAPALENVAGAVKPLQESLAAMRGTLTRMLDFRQPGIHALVAHMAEIDRQLDRELEKDVLYLEQLFDKQRADDLVRVAKDLAARRRDLANLLESYRKAPDEAKKKELLAEVSRLKARMQEMMRRMAELAKGINDEHMNREAVAEMMKSNDALGSMEDIEKKLAAGDVEGAMKALDQLGNTMQQMLSSLERTAGRPGEKNQALMKEMLAFKKQLEEVESRQQDLAKDTDQLRGEYRKRIAQKMKQLEGAAQKLEQLAGEARQEVQQAEKGISTRSEEDFAQARDRLRDLEKALQARDLDAARETAHRVIGPMQRLAVGLQDDAFLAERYPQLRMKDGREVREAQRHAQAALGPARKVKDELDRMFPDPRSVLSQKEQQRLDELAQQQGALEKEAGGLQQKLQELSQKAPVFPPESGDMLGGSQQHMQRAQGQLAQRNPQAGHGEQRQALDDLERFRKGLDEMAKNQKGGGGAGGFPFPFGEDRGGREGEGMEASREKVEIPGADQYKVPDEFRKDLLEAMKQGAPEPYKGDVQHYYEELVK